MNIYLDLDGVLLDRSGRLAVGVEAFLEVATRHHSTWWLTTHCKGDPQPAVRRLARAGASSEVLRLSDMISATTWNTLKTEAIDFGQDFLWIDDYVLDAERKKLVERNRDECLRIIDLGRHPDALRALAAQLRSGLSSCASTM